MKTKFITVDGYSQLETVRNPRKVKKQPFTKKVKKLVKITCTVLSQSFKEFKDNKAKAKRLENCYKSQRNQGTERLSKSAFVFTKLRKAEKKAPKHLSKSERHSRNFLRKKVALGVATSFVAVILCTLTSMSTISFGAVALEGDSETPTQAQTQEVSVRDSEVSKVVHSSITKSMSRDDVLTSGYGLYIDKKLAGVSVDKESLEDALQANLDQYKAKYDDETTDMFANKVEIVAGSYSSKDFDAAENIVEKNSDKFSYSLSTDIIYKERVPYTTEIKYDSSKPTSYKKVTQKGINGKQKVTLRVTYVDKVQTDCVTTEVKTLREAQKKIVVVGTKKPTSASTSYSTYSTTASGSFMWPVPYTRNITSGYGMRWGRMHTGIDIASAGVYGQPIVASDSGVVTWAGYDSSGYGNYVIIDHGNGYKTLYGHCSSLAVSNGQSVSKGQTIAYVGSTGNSTGPHLHFEVRSGNARLNPLGFV